MADENEDDRHTDLEAAFDAADEAAGGFEEPKAEVIKPDEVEDPPPTDTEPPVDKVEEPPKAAADKPDTETVPPEGDEVPAVDDDKPKAAAAPESWSPTVREKWAELPDEVKEVVNKREAEISQTLQNTARERQQAHDFRSIVTPYQAVMAAEGMTDPFKAVNGMFQTVAALQQGTPQQKAERIAGLIDHYAVDIGALDNVLSGSAADPEQTKIDAAVAAAVAPYQESHDRLNGMMTSQAAATQQNASTEVETFGSDKDFFADVRNSMADLLDMATAQNRSLSLEDAYDQACYMNPEIRQVMTQRADAKRLAEAGGTAAGKRRAASTLSGGRSVPPLAPAEGETLRDTLERAFDA